ncbi:hypothetical protein BDFG_08432 [Blastomyces dermatitidis ATCC 26199]|nr:hypothetical protein BDFG_08432 [Blastomyces dermatitidis ATCC 26199]
MPTLSSGTKVVFKGPTGSIMCEGEFEFMKSLHNVMPTITPKPWAWGEYKKKERYFMLTDFREGRRKVWPKLHKKSGFPTGKFGFHTTLPVTSIHMFTTDLDKNGRWPEFERLCDLTFESSSERGQKYKAVPPFMETVGMRIQQDTYEGIVPAPTALVIIVYLLKGHKSARKMICTRRQRKQRMRKKKEEEEDETYSRNLVAGPSLGQVDLGGWVGC